MAVTGFGHAESAVQLSVVADLVFVGVSSAPVAEGSVIVALGCALGLVGFALMTQGFAHSGQDFAPAAEGSVVVALGCALCPLGFALMTGGFAHFGQNFAPAALGVEDVLHWSLVRWGLENYVVTDFLELLAHFLEQHFDPWDFGGSAWHQNYVD